MKNVIKLLEEFLVASSLELSFKKKTKDIGRHTNNLSHHGVCYASGGGWKEMYPTLGHPFWN